MALLPMDRQEPGCIQSPGFKQASLRKRRAAQRARRRKAVEVGRSLTPSRTLSPLGDPYAGNPPPYPFQPPLRDTESLDKQFENYRLDDGYSFLLLFHPYL